MNKLLFAALISVVVLSLFIPSSAWTMRERNVTMIPTLAETRFEPLMESMGLGGNITNATASNGTIPSAYDITMETVGIGTDALGQVFFVILGLMVFGSVSIAQRTVIPTAIFGIFALLYAIVFIPATYAIASGIVIVIAITVVIYQVAKPRGA